MLLEFPHSSVPAYTEKIIFELLKLGTTPIIVHPERNKAIQNKTDILYKFIQQGALAQVTATSYIGGFGNDVASLSRKLVEHGLVQIVASDAHTMKNRNFVLSEALLQIGQDFGEQKAMQFEQNAEDLINGANVIASNYRKIEKRNGSFSSDCYILRRSFGVNVRKKETKIYLDKDRVQSRCFYIFTKRVLDIIFSVIGLIVLTPIFLIVSLWIKLCDNGPVFYIQERVGLNGKKFNIYKFRSMYVNADLLLEKLKQKNEVQGPMFKMKHDPRVTSVGRFIRKTSIDELPQLVNVLKGDMSLVGPRPPLPDEVKQYSEYDLQRLWVVPGCTGLWQATERNNVGFDEMVDLDLAYIQKRSLIFDLKIILLTIGLFLIRMTLISIIIKLLMYYN